MKLPPKIEHSEVPAAPIDPIDFRTAHYAKLLFAQGSNGWEHFKGDMYVRRIYPPNHRSFTEEDHRAMVKLLGDCGVTVHYPNDWHPECLSYMVRYEGIKALEGIGLGRDDAGTLRFPYYPYQPEAIANDDKAILYSRFHDAPLGAWKKQRNWIGGKPLRRLEIDYADLRGSDGKKLTSTEAFEFLSGWFETRFGFKPTHSAHFPMGMITLDMTSEQYNTLNQTEPSPQTAVRNVKLMQYYRPEKPFNGSPRGH